MKSRERVLTAINHKEPDRVAVDFGGHRSSGIMAIAYARLKKYLGITGGDIYVYDIPQQSAIIEPEVLNRFQVDVIELGRGFGLEKEYWKEWQLPDGTPGKIPAHINLVKENGNWFACSDDGTRIAAQPKGSLYFDQIYFPLQGVKDLKIVDFDEAFEKSMWNKLSNPPAPLGYDSEGMQKLREGAKKLRESTDRAIVALFGGNLHEIPQFLFRADNWFMMLASEPDQTHHFLDQLVEYHLNNLEKFLSAVGDYIDIIQFGDDLGMQTGPQISKKMYDTFLKPRHSILWNRAKKLANVKVMLHCCGGVYPLLPSFIEAGLDIINPVQTTCKDMEAERLKKEFGKDLVFWGGGCNTRDILGTGTPEQVTQDVRERVNILAPGGGFVFQQIHNIMANVPPENIVAMFNAVHST